MTHDDAWKLIEFFWKLIDFLIYNFFYICYRHYVALNRDNFNGLITVSSL